jgi:hypothetical protein
MDQFNSKARPSYLMTKLEYTGYLTTSLTLGFEFVVPSWMKMQAHVEWASFMYFYQEKVKTGQQDHHHS